MPRPRSQYPTELELEILKIVWRLESASARQVRDALAATRNLAMTTVVTVMNKMVAKSLLHRDQRSRAAGGNLYRAVVSRERTSQRLLADLKRRLFEGSAVAMVQHLLNGDEIDPAELDELKRQIELRRAGSTHQSATGAG